MSYERLGDLLAEYIINRGLVGNPEGYMKSLWQDMQHQLQIFITHMNNDSQYHNAINCENAYWQHPQEHGTKDQLPREMSRSTERVICRLMTQAIYFANAWSKAVQEDITGDSVHNKEIKGLIRCTIVDVYNDILRANACEGWWGTYYAWYVVDHISGGLTAHGGQNDCTRGKYKTIQLNTWPMRNQMKTWLKQNKQMKEKLAQEEISGGCTGRQVKTREQLQKEGEIQDPEAENKKDEELKSQMKTHFRKILDTLQIQMKKEEGKLRASRAPAPQYPSVDDADEKNAEDIERKIEKAIEAVQDHLHAVIEQTTGEKAAAATKAATTPSKDTSGKEG
ncbi:hypothetical protein AK88_00827 [Plasmodium fragile]|uniref:Schizont-infected cell agglutination extracellular alpha domain-containing protein n=1 Tax=Plasmodium fragile TaxID=5857 RepID=A0A0D9QU15_PLAFR|nr:uncharacterized protein AK88_00827 [Plasmodium fragile]KJP89616.1 hypothetical protein AK88_00827 [Plasmodium fragile]